MTLPRDASLEYHLGELATATNQQCSGHSLPTIAADIRRVLDVGCGVGQSLVALNLPSGVEAHGVDIDVAAIRFGNNNFSGLRLVVSAGENLPFPDGYFDLVFCRVSLPYMHIPSALAEFSRVLKDEGQLWMALHPLQMFRHDFLQALRHANGKAVIYRLYAFFNSLLLALGWQMRYPLNASRIESYQVPSILRRALLRSAFMNIEFSNEGSGSVAMAVRSPRGS